jgi:hypothetical protein
MSKIAENRPKWAKLSAPLVSLYFVNVVQHLRDFERFEMNKRDLDRIWIAF